MPRSPPNKTPRNPPNKIILNDLNIKGQKPKDRPFLVWDKKQRGLALCVQPSGHLSFKCIYSRRGQPRWYHLGHVDIGVAKARIAARKILVQVDDGKDPQADKKAERSIGTFAELAALYRDHAKKVNKSWQQADNLVTRYVLPRWGKLQRDNISRSDVVSMLAKIDAPILANQVLASASAIFTWAIKQELGVTINPCSKVDRNETNERERILSDGEIPKFWTAFNDRVEGLALKMILLTGQRPIEVSHMRTEHIEDGWWTLPGKPEPKLGWPGTKNSKTHYVYLPKAAQQIIEQLGSTGMIFAGARGVPVSGLDKDMRTICKALGVEQRATPHDLRRTFGSSVTRLKFGTDAMDRILNHKEGKKKTTRTYDRNEYGAEDKAIMEAVASLLLALIDPVMGAQNMALIDKVSVAKILSVIDTARAAKILSLIDKARGDKILSLIDEVAAEKIISLIDSDGPANVVVGAFGKGK